MDGNDLDEAQIAAVEAPSTTWLQLNIEFAQSSRADEIAAQHLLPVLQQAHQRGDLTWWFMRKPPGWRVRMLRVSSELEEFVAVRTALERARTNGVVSRWWLSIYEEETTAFGGPLGMTLAHDVFVADSTGIAHLLTERPFGKDVPDRRLLSLILMTHLQRAAGLDRYERGDVWAKVAAQRPTPDLAPETRKTLIEKARALLTTDTAAVTCESGPFSAVSGWAQDLAAVGAELGASAQQGSMARGLRSVLALHVLFHWNRIGISVNQQSVWATVSRDALIG
ncbi:thiopeptide-type bacteriocin biosynthesis protein [Kineosporia babensis]|uniref:Thiopeptide-type bacteriocin biosynthesis protein n=1 Tax=Kineosporia babensis TaxID=499548 RepID=A0A9X1NN77_9ACTN|nr:thiopeptide-type bacteriocin biosynthesis protein [Kineosporia babensis]MCD5316829.1 thiopeptide-type bacteriocin biosynthesis protein [Kineosporia babensis]